MLRFRCRAMEDSKLGHHAQGIRKIPSLHGFSSHDFIYRRPFNYNLLSGSRDSPKRSVLQRVIKSDQKIQLVHPVVAILSAQLILGQPRIWCLPPSLVCDRERQHLHDLWLFAYHHSIIELVISSRKLHNKIRGTLDTRSCKTA
jgi:hypothetical protein